MSPLQIIARRQRARGLRGTRAGRRRQRLRFARRMEQRFAGYYGDAWREWYLRDVADLMPFPPPEQ